MGRRRNSISVIDCSISTEGRHHWYVMSRMIHRLIAPPFGCCWCTGRLSAKPEEKKARIKQITLSYNTSFRISHVTFDKYKIDRDPGHKTSISDKLESCTQRVSSIVYMSANTIRTITLSPWRPCPGGPLGPGIPGNPGSPWNKTYVHGAYHIKKICQASWHKPFNII